MSKRTKKQHYISRTYLQEFSSPLKKRDLLWVRDLKGTWRQSRPECEGCENDFQSLIDEFGNKSDELESYFAPYEGEFKCIIRQIEKTHSFPQGPEQQGVFFSIMGLFAVRINPAKNQFQHFASEAMKKTMGLLLSSKNDYEHFMKKIRQEGYIQDEPVAYEEMLSFHQKGEYTLKHDPMWILETLFRSAATVTDHLHERNWMVAEAPGPYFITSNKPVNPFWTVSLPLDRIDKPPWPDPRAFATHPIITAMYTPYNESTGRFPPFLPGFRSLGSIITFPITTRLALIGSWSPLPRYGKIDYCTVQAINWVTANSGANYVYSPQKLPILPWTSHIALCLQDFHNHLGTRLLR